MIFLGWVTVLILAIAGLIMYVKAVNDAQNGYKKRALIDTVFSITSFSLSFWVFTKVLVM